MSDQNRPGGIDRRQFMKFAGGAAAAAASAPVIARWAGPVLDPLAVTNAGAVPVPADMTLGGTDGWIAMPATPAIPPFHPDVLAPPGLTTYIFGFRNITGYSGAMKVNQKYHAQASAPLFWAKEFNPAAPQDFFVDLANLGLALRPDLFDEHSLHWHGFRNVIPFFDGEPVGSLSVPPAGSFRYAYRPRDPGTYMFHCHVEDVEHVHMGMTGMVYVRALQDVTSPGLGGYNRFAYNDGDGSTGFDREFAMLLSEVWAESHWADAHIQLPEWSDYRPDFSQINGRVYPDTIAPSAALDPLDPGYPIGDPTYPANPSFFVAEHDVDGYLVPPTPWTGDPAGAYDHLANQPISSLVQCNAGEKVLFRISNLGFKQATMTLEGIPFTVVGKDATPMRGRDGSDTSYKTNGINLGAGESADVLFTAPPYHGSAPYNTYMFFNRNFTRDSNRLGAARGGQSTEVRVYPPSTTVPTQHFPNQTFDL